MNVFVVIFSWPLLQCTSIPPLIHNILTVQLRDINAPSSLTAKTWPVARWVPNHFLNHSLTSPVLWSCWYTQMMKNIRFNSLIQQQTRKHTKTPSLCDIEPYASHRWSKQCCFCFHWCDHQISKSSKACREKRTVKSNSVKTWTSYDILFRKILVKWRLYLVHYFSCYFLQYVCYIFNFITYCWMSASLSSAFPHCFSVMPQRLHCNSSKHHLGEKNDSGEIFMTIPCPLAYEILIMGI